MKAPFLEQADQSISLPALALKYGTISRDQYRQIMKLALLKQNQGHDPDFGQLLLTHRYATGYQVGLLNLIRQYLVIKKQGREFGRIAIEKGFVSESDIEAALEFQKKEFSHVKRRKLIGDILVESGALTAKQKNAILREQTFLDRAAAQIYEDSDPEISDYEKKFLQIKVLDKEFAASVIEKKLASEEQVKTALKIQEEEFEKNNRVHSLGDAMVELKFLTREQSSLINKDVAMAGDSENTRPEPIDIKISHDQMQASVKIRDREKADLDAIKRALDEKGIGFGIYPDAILQCQLDVGKTEFIVAKQDFTLEILKNRKTVYHFDTQKMDEEFKKGATLAEQRLGKGSFLKKDLFGNTVEHATGRELSLRCGSGTRLSRDRTKVFAGKTGFASLSIEKKFYVHPVINIFEDADLKYGPLESFASFNIKGVLTGAYPVTAGNITAGEIRGAVVEAVGCVRSGLGITGSFISAQGDIYADYLHHCRIETFGNIYIKNEIIDCTILTSGKIHSPECRVIGSALYAKKGIELGGAGSLRTDPCILAAGTEHHVIELTSRIEREMKQAGAKKDALMLQKNEKENSARKIFQKMVELKIFHDRAEIKKGRLSAEFKKHKSTADPKNLKNLVVLINNFRDRMNASIEELKQLNDIKKKYDKEIKLIEKQIHQLEPEVKKIVSRLETDMFAFFEWTRKQESSTHIKINHSALAGTVLKGVFSSIVLKEKISDFHVFEKEDINTGFKMMLERSADLKAG